MEKFNGVLLNDVDGVDNVSRNKGKIDQYDQILEANMMADIVRASNRLKMFNTFRVQNDKMYRDKELGEARKREIREPLEAALMEIEVLTGKLQRREEVISSLRKQVYSEIVRNTTKSSGLEDNSRANHIHELLTSDEKKQLELLDQVESLKDFINIQQQQIHKLRNVIQFQNSKIKELYDDIEMQEFVQKEQIRRLENDKDTYMNMLEHREHKIEQFIEEKMELRDKCSDLQKALSDQTMETKKIKEQFKKLQEEFQILQNSHDKETNRIMEIEMKNQQLTEENYILTEKTQDLQSR
jgi:chromosome segregation ATPase